MIGIHSLPIEFRIDIGESRAALSLRQGDFESSLFDTTGGTGGWNRPKPMILAGGGARALQPRRAHALLGAGRARPRLRLARGGPSFAYSPPVHSYHTRRDRVASLTTRRLHGAAIQRPLPLGPGRALTLPCGWNNAGRTADVAKYKARADALRASIDKHLWSAKGGAGWTSGGAYTDGPSS